MLIHLGELVPEGTPRIYAIGPGTLFLWVFIIFPLTLATFGIGAVTGANTPPLSDSNIHVNQQRFKHAVKHMLTSWLSPPDVPT